jgi:hypothetical protein
MRNTVRGDVSKAAATWEALQPSSVLSRMRARVAIRTELFPLRISPVESFPFFFRQLYWVSLPSHGGCTSPQPDVAASILTSTTEPTEPLLLT